jgi:hypothetical protein
MSARQIGLLLIVVGVAAALFGGLADSVNVGRAGFGWKQGVLLGVGIAVALVGAVVALRAPASDAAPGSEGAAPGSEGAASGPDTLP